MNGFFVFDYTGEPFQLFGTKHLIVIAFYAAVILWFFLGWKNPSEAGKKRMRYLLAGILIVGETTWHIWSAVGGTWTLTYHLPLHICSIMVWLSIYMLFTKNYRIFEFAYFIGLAGAMQAFLTPEAGIYGIWHFRAVQTLVVHGTLMVVPIYMALKEGFRPTWRSFVRVAVGVNLYMILIHFVNLGLESNYLFTRHKPPSASLLDVLGPWPWYILSMEALGFVIFFLLYLPWMIKDLRAKKAKPAAV